MVVTTKMESKTHKKSKIMSSVLIILSHKETRRAIKELFVPADAKLVLLNAELLRLARLPSNSAFAQHRIALCKRCIELLSAPEPAADAASELERMLSALSL